MGLVVLLLAAFAFAPQQGAGVCVQPVSTAHWVEVSASSGVVLSTFADACCPPRPDAVPDAPCLPEDGCCASCLSHGNRSAGTPAVPGPAQEPAAGRAGRAEAHVGSGHNGTVWHPPRG